MAIECCKFKFQFYSAKLYTLDKVNTTNRVLTAILNSFSLQHHVIVLMFTSNEIRLLRHSRQMKQEIIAKKMGIT